MRLSAPQAESGDLLLSLTNVKKHFPIRRKPFIERPMHLRAVDGIDLKVPIGSTYGIVGESGSGKSTLGRLIAKLDHVTSGVISLAGEDVTSLRGRRRRHFRRQVQMVFQDPYSSFDPTSPLYASVVEPLQALEGLSRSERRNKAAELFRMVGLRPSLIDRYPRELSGGQLQRAAIARALGTKPALLVLDEPVSALDLSTQGEIINLLEDLRNSAKLSYVMIAHDLAVVRHACDRVAVMHLGRVVEDGPTEEVYERPRHPYTAALLAAIPTLESKETGPERIILRGEPPSPIDPPSGCSFRTRCPWAMEICAQEDPPAISTATGVTAYCHLHTHGPTLEGRSILTLDVPAAARR